MGLFFPVIMAGGSGTRFWPLSRKSRPKQFLALASDRPLIVETLARIKLVAPARQTYVVCGPSHAGTVMQLLKGFSPANLLIEPVARNTAPAIALAAYHLARKHPDGILAVLPSDHHIADVPKFQQALLQAKALAEKGLLVTLGIRPTHAETGFGYIELGDRIGGGGHRVKAFVEKPDLKTAIRYLKSRKFLWNGGIFVFRADAMIEAFEKIQPEIAQAMRKIEGSAGKPSFQATLAREFKRLPSISIDYGIMEKADNIAVVPSDFGWSDVGSFAALAEVRPTDSEGNLFEGERILGIDCRNCVVVGKDRPLALLGVSNLVVIDAGDAILVIDKSKSQEVRQIVAALQQKKLERYL